MKAYGGDIIIRLDLDTFCSIFAVPFQVAGSLLLLLFNISTRRENIIKQFSEKGFISTDSTNKLEYDKELLKKRFRDAWINKFSFGLIALGYILNEISKESEFSIIHLIVATLFTMCITYFIVFLIVKYSPNINKELTNDELNDLGLRPDFKVISAKDIDDILPELRDDYDK